MLLLSNHQIQKYFLGLLALHISLGCLRFLFPFQIVNLGGNEALISIASTLFSIGQILGFLFLGVIITSKRSRVLTGGFFLLILMTIMSFTTDPIILSIARTFEGLGYGILFLSIVSIATQFPTKEGEVIGGLFAAVFIGLAVGQGIAGLVWNILLEITKLNSTQSIQSISLVASFITLSTIAILYPLLKSDTKISRNDWKLQHTHLRTWLRTIFTIPSFGVLMIIYSLYDFAHGLYTPNLSILLNQQGIDTIGLSFGYLIGDITWGISQIFAGRIVDRVGYPTPLVLSLMMKGIVVIFYPEISLLISLFAVLFLAGLAEGFLEPSRNKAALSFEKIQEFTHSHTHLDFGFSTSGSFTFGVHEHHHKHESRPETIVGTLQSTGIIFFGIGSLVGSWLLMQGLTLDIVTIIGGLCLAFASFFSIMLSVITKFIK